MTYEQFEEILKQRIEDYFGIEVEKHIRYRVNEERIGFLLKFPTEVQPIIYPEGLYEMYSDTSDMSMIIDMIEELKECRYVELVKNIIDEWDNVKTYLRCFVVQQTHLEAFQREEFVYKRDLDLLIGIYVEVPIPEGGKAAITVKKGMLDLWGLTEEELFDWVCEQNRELYTVQPLRDVMDEYINKGELSLSREEIPRDVLVISNERGYRGAVGILDKEILEKVSKQLDDSFVFLIVSLHEALAFKADIESFEAIKETAQQMCEFVAPEDVVSDSVYFYDSMMKTIDMLL